MNDDLLVPYLRKASQYEYIETIGGGAFGSVSRVKDKKTGKIYAKKNIPFPPSDYYAPLYFFREFLSLRDFQVKGLPYLQLEGFNFPQNGEDAFIVTELVEGGSLSSLIRHKFSSCPDIPTAKMIIIYGLAFAIKNLHSRSIVHRDLKPDNIIINKDGEPVLADFGFARQIDDIFMTSNLGTLAYMAPELLINGEIESSLSIDVYSFAVLLLEIIYCKLTFNNGKLPNDKRNEHKFIRHIKSGKRFDMPGADIVPANFQKVITECWDQVPSKRLPMKKIIKYLEDDLVLPGCNMEVYHQYIDKLNSIYQNYKLQKLSTKDEEVHITKEFNFL